MQWLYLFSSYCLDFFTIKHLTLITLTKFLNARFPNYVTLPHYVIS